MASNTLLITGGAGFIGANAGAFFSEKGWDVVVLDNLSRKGADINLDWLKKNYDVRFIGGDIRDSDLVNRTFRECKPEVTIHLAGQVAVTTSVAEPRRDFEINALGTLNVLEGIRINSPHTFFINAATNKLYGRIESLKLIERDGRYDYESRVRGIDESQPLDFHSPYGCSKGAADQYTIDYARIYGLNTVTFRQSCIYGPHQMGIEDQGWVAWFIIAALSGRSITIYGNGKQVRDVLHASDLVDCYSKAIDHRSKISGQAFNVGGGPENTVSLLELTSLISEFTGRVPIVTTKDWRPGDQTVFECNLDKVKRVLGWYPRVEARAGIKSLIDWYLNNGDLCLH